MRVFVTVLDVRKIGHLNIETKMLDIEARVLIGWYSLASLSERVPTRCFYVKVAYLSYGEYIYITTCFSNRKICATQKYHVSLVVKPVPT